MKKIVRVVLAIVFVFGIILASAPQYALAKTDPESTATPKPLIAAGAWTSGSAVDVSGLVGSAPTWLQWLANGVKVTEAGKICHPMRGGQFGWVGQIMQYKNGEWIKLTTTNDWVPNKEGEFMSCAQAPAAGTYALFGYWIRPAGYVEAAKAPASVNCADLVWGTIDLDSGTWTFTGIVSGLPSGTRIDLSVNAASLPAGISITGTTSTSTDNSAGDFTLTTAFSATPDYLDVTFTVPTYGCTYSRTYGF